MVRKTKREVIELITASVVLEGMAARLITQIATDEEIAGLRKMFATFENGQLRAHLDEDSELRALNSTSPSSGSATTMS